MKIAIIISAVLITTATQAKPSAVDVFDGDRYRSRQVHAQASADTLRAVNRKSARHHKGKRKTAPMPRPRPAPGYLADVLGGRPSGCPHRFCGCGASLQVFGRIIPTLNLAANWLRFPRTAPASGMVAARRGHVFVLKQHIGGNTWLVHDSNSGRGRTRIHPRSIAGFTIVNPHGRAADMTTFPKDNMAAKIAFYGDPRGANGLVNPKWYAANITHVTPPYQMTYARTPIHGIAFHKKCAPALLAALTTIWEHCGKDQKQVEQFHLQEFGGSFNYRLIRGRAELSNHAFGIAIDIEPTGNELGRVHGEMQPFAITAFKDQGFKWGGDYQGRKDWMHFEAVS